MNRSRLLLVSMVVTAVLVAASAAWMASLAMPTNYAASKETVRLRNAFLASVGNPDDFRWLPTTPPTSFKQETQPAPSEFTDLVRAVLDDGVERSEFEKAILIARHLKSKPGDGTPISASTREAYRRIIESGLGWCSDYTQVVNGIAHAAGLAIREWGAAFDGFGGDGHAFSEVDDSRFRKWVFFDSYFSFYVRERTSGVPLSVLELRRILRGSAENVEVVPISGDGTSFKTDQHALDYYRRGMDQFYLWWGNNVFSYDRHPIISRLSAISPAVGQMAAILIGIHPRIRIIPSQTNGPLIDRLFAKRNMFLGVLAVGFVLAAALLMQFVYYRRLRRQAQAVRFARTGDYQQIP